MKSFEVLNAQPALEKLAKQDLPLAVSVKLLEPFKKANEIHQTIVQKRSALFAKYGKLDKKTKETHVLPKNKVKFAKEYTELMETELDWKSDPIEISEFGDGVNLSVKEVAQITWFLNVA